MVGKQRGNTLLGLVVGALAGLGIALAAAVYITKMPVPFTNTTAPRQADSDAAEIRKNKDWNPNAPLAGRNPARSTPAVSGELSDQNQDQDVAEPTSTSVPDPVRMPEPAAKAAPKPAEAMAATPAMTAAPAVPARDSSTDPLGDLAKAVSAPAMAVAPPAYRVRSGDPLGDLAQSVTTAPARAASPAALANARPAELMPAGSVSDPFKYFVQTGAFRTEEDAARQLGRLQSLGLQARVTEREQAGRTVYRVRVGPFERKDDADTLTDRLSGHSIDTALVRVQR